MNMKTLEKFSNPHLASGLVKDMKRLLQRPVVFMEFCGGHTVEIIKSGIRNMLPEHLRLLSGPGCPVCVTDASDIDKAMMAANIPGVILATFGDMLKVPGTCGSLLDARSNGTDVRVIYSAAEALSIAQANPGSPVVFVAIGFETTAPTVAATVLEARQRNVQNFYLLCFHKRCPPIMREMLEAGETRLDGILCPGHVSAVIGVEPYAFIPQDYRVACAVSGFEPIDILFSLHRLCRQISTGLFDVDRVYRRGVQPGGNPTALNLMEKVFQPATDRWRGFGRVFGSGLKLKNAYSAFDAEKIFDLHDGVCEEPENCICGSILRGTKTPADCTLYGKKCLPEHPVGPCMVSPEGSCAAHLRYGGLDNFK
ncbi:MAG: hydrogenase formation protein HypD [Desulfobacterales bacterium]